MDRRDTLPRGGHGDIPDAGIHTETRAFTPIRPPGRRPGQQRAAPNWHDRPGRAPISVDELIAVGTAFDPPVGELVLPARYVPVEAARRRPARITLRDISVAALDDDELMDSVIENP